MVTDRWRFALPAFHPRTLHSLDWIAAHRIGIAQIVEQRRQGSQLATDRCAAQGTALEITAPSQYVSAADAAEPCRILDASKAHELAQVGFIRTARAWVINVGEPSDRRRHLGQLVKLEGGEVARWDRLGYGQG